MEDVKSVCSVLRAELKEGKVSSLFLLIFRDKRIYFADFKI